MKDENTAECNICKNTYKIPDGSTTTLVRHLQQCHGDNESVKNMVSEMDKTRAKKKEKLEAEKKKNESQKKLTTFIKRKGTMDEVKKKKVDEAIIKHIVKSNKPFSIVEDESFRELLFELDPNYICYSRKTARIKFDDMAAKVEVDLKTEILKDITESGHKTVSIMTDHGTGNDISKTKKNVVVLSRTTKDFQLKTDTVAVINCSESQTGLQIRKSVKEALEKALGLDNTWIVNWVTDGAANVTSARNPLNFQSIGMNIHFDGWCVDHILELCCEDSLKQNCLCLKEGIAKMRNLVNHLSRSSDGRVKFREVMQENGMDPLRSVKGTSNRFFTKHFEVDRFLELHEAIELFFESQHNFPDNCYPLDDDEWRSLEVYKDSLSIIVKASEILEGRDYVTSSSVIPFLDAIHSELVKLAAIKDGEAKIYLEQLVRSCEKRFSLDLYKTKVPYNVMTLLDVRYGDLYFNEDQKSKAISDIYNDIIFTYDRMGSVAETGSGTQSHPVQDQIEDNSR